VFEARYQLSREVAVGSLSAQETHHVRTGEVQGRVLDG